jgi:hypothetical protein
MTAADGPERQRLLVVNSDFIASLPEHEREELLAAIEDACKEV